MYITTVKIHPNRSVFVELRHFLAYLFSFFHHEDFMHNDIQINSVLSDAYPEAYHWISQAFVGRISSYNFISYHHKHTGVNFYMSTQYHF